MTTPKFNEDTLSEKLAIEQLKRMKYEIITGDKLDPQETGSSTIRKNRIVQKEGV